jgi:hypothetical protein
MTPGTPLFCNHCGRSFDVKLCPRLHPNPRIAEVCSQCGSRDLSTPQPAISNVWQVVQFSIRLIIVLLIVYVVLAGFLEFLTSKETQNALLALGFLAIALFWLWQMVPNWLRKMVRWTLQKGRRS